MTDCKKKNCNVIFIQDGQDIGGKKHLCLDFTGGDVVKSCVQWFLFVVTALSCPCAALHGGTATFTARDAVE